MKIDENRTAWQIIETLAREKEGVGEEFSLRWASLDYDENRIEFADYRLRNFDTEELIYGKVYV